jgi:hypothetical protein
VNAATAGCSIAQHCIDIMMQCEGSKIAEAEAAVSVNEKKLLVMHVHVRLCTSGAGGMAVTCASLLLQH